MTETTYLQFDGLNNPVALQDAGALLPVISQVLAAWPHRVSHTALSDPFVTIRPGTGTQWALELQEAPSAPRFWDTVNVICDLVAEMAWERLRSDTALLCLHAAAVAFAGRLIVFPNTRRAGKSTLTAALAQLGHRVYTDDFLPVRIDPQDHTFLGIANGVAPRIRLPLPKDFSATFHDWAQHDTGPANKQYKYLTSATIAPSAETMPLGALVILDRKDDPVVPMLETISRADALTSLITQNFARTQLSGAILTSMDALSRHLPVFRLTYHCGEAAARFLATHPALQALPAARNADAQQGVEPAPLHKQYEPKPAFIPSHQYVQAAGLTETQVGDDHFLADSNGLSIYRLNAGSGAIWKVLSEPTALEEVIEILAAAFEDVATSQIATDSEYLMRHLAEAQLIVPAASELAVR